MNFSMLLLVGLLVSALVAGCKKEAAPAAIATAVGPQPAASTAAAKERSPQDSVYLKATQVFEEFAKVVEQNQSAPDEGLAKCKNFATAKIPELKTLTAQIKAIETGPKAAEYMQEIMESNEKIKSATDKVSKVAQEKYGPKGADVMLILADLTLARL